MSEPFRIISAVDSEVPILLSVPHCGTEFPPELKAEFKPELSKVPDDTDWFVDKLYDFAPAMGISMITASYSRWVIDLNRDPQSKPLYTDGRIITALCPTTTFDGEKLYVDGRDEVSPEEVKRRLELYYYPYHEKVREMLDALKSKFKRVLLWDCHSIRELVPSIRKEKFPDLILGDADGTSASAGVIEAVLSILDHSKYTTSHNFPFKGGYITRHFGNPGSNEHALQLEMTKVNYMDDSERNYHEERANRVRSILKAALEGVIEVL